MALFNISKFIKEKNLDLKVVAFHLFPTNKHPQAAFKRILDGDALLDSDQMSKLASMAGVSVGDMFSDKWQARSTDGFITFTKGTFTAELNTGTWITKLFDNASLFHDSVIHSGSTPLSQYLSALERIIEEHKN
jgi:hypothetical protein